MYHKLSHIKLNKIIDECIDKILKESSDVNTILYRCFDGNDIVNGEWIWLSTNYADKQYGKHCSEFSIPLNNFNIADSNTVIEYIKRFDIKDWSDAMYDEFIEQAMEWFDWDAYKEGRISDDKAYNNIPSIAWTEVMEHPNYYTFAERLKNDGYDGYCFTYLDSYAGYPTYFAFFNAKEILPYQIK